MPHLTRNRGRTLKRLLGTTAFVVSVMALPALAGTLDDPVTAMDIVSQDAIDTSSTEPDTILTAIAVIIMLMMAGGAF